MEAGYHICFARFCKRTLSSGHLERIQLSTRVSMQIPPPQCIAFHKPGIHDTAAMISERKTAFVVFNGPDLERNGVLPTAVKGIQAAVSQTEAVPKNITTIAEKMVWELFSLAEMISNIVSLQVELGDYLSFYDGISIASVFDGVELSDIVKLLRDHDIYVGQSIVNEREYLYYFIGNCNVLQQVAVRDEGTQRFHQEQNQFAKLPTSLLLFILKTRHPDIMRTTRHFRQDLLRELKKYDLQGLIRERGWNTDDPTFIDGTSVATTLHVHHKDVISNALQSVCPGEIIPSELVRESRQTIYMFC
ncbi:hypothetical protein F5146DRAFT_1000522 [Armillaria mellea]|nr:hypothetical protein F5146DRAFT_1000522 [Armillaria mellea]